MIYIAQKPFTKITIISFFTVIQSSSVILNTHLEVVDSKIMLSHVRYKYRIASEPFLANVTYNQGQPYKGELLTSFGMPQYISVTFDYWVIRFCTFYSAINFIFTVLPTDCSVPGNTRGYSFPENLFARFLSWNADFISNGTRTRGSYWWPIDWWEILVSENVYSANTP